jgi:hypothetical protein
MAARTEELVFILEKQNIGKEERDRILQELSQTLTEPSFIKSEVVKEIVYNSNVLDSLAKSLEENVWEWTKDWPIWVDEFIQNLSRYFAIREGFSDNKVKKLSDAFRRYILSGHWDPLNALAELANFKGLQNTLLNDEKLYNTLVAEIRNPNVPKLLCNLASDDSWKKKLLEDEDLIIQLLALPPNEGVWDLFARMALHEEAKALFLREYLVKKASKSSYVRCADICALLCNDDDNAMKEAWVVRTVTLLDSLLSTGVANADGVSYNLLELVLPISNLAVIEANKEVLGKYVIPRLVRVLSEDVEHTLLDKSNLVRATEEAAEALWQLSYLEANQSLIIEADGIAKMKYALQKTRDPQLKQNIQGALFMLSRNSH